MQIPGGGRTLDLITYMNKQMVQSGFRVKTQD